MSRYVVAAETRELIDQLLREADLLAGHHIRAETPYADVEAAGGNREAFSRETQAENEMAIDRLLSWVKQLRERVATIPDDDIARPFWAEAAGIAQQMLSDRLASAECVEDHPYLLELRTDDTVNDFLGSWIGIVSICGSDSARARLVEFTEVATAGQPSV